METDEMEMRKVLSFLSPLLNESAEDMFGSVLNERYDEDDYSSDIEECLGTLQRDM